MPIDHIFKFFVPKNRIFFDLFNEQSDNLVRIASRLDALMNATNLDRQDELEKEIEHLEHVCDGSTHAILTELSKSFITPFDREDIHRLATVLDEIADYINGASKRMRMYKITEFSPAMVRLSALILQSCEELQKAIHELKNMKNLRNVTDALVRINSLENYADDVFDAAVADLFENESNAVEIIKKKEILSALETATDMAEDAANVIESIIIKIS